MIWLLSAANLIYLVSYSVRDVVLLRALTIVGATCLAGYFWMRPDPLMGPVYWNLVSIVLNAWAIARRTRRRHSAPAASHVGATLPRSTVIRMRHTQLPYGGARQRRPGPFSRAGVERYGRIDGERRTVGNVSNRHP